MAQASRWSRAAAVISILAIGLVVVGVCPAHAQKPPSSQFTKAYEAGVDAFRLGQYAEARAHLERARDFEPTLPGPHRFLAAVAQVEQRWADCVTEARIAIKLNPLSSEIAATRQLHDECRVAWGKQEFRGEYADGGAVAVTANVDGATVALGGLKYGATPMAPRAIAVGKVTVTLTKIGWLTATVEADILPGVVTDVVVELQPDPAAVVERPGVETKPPPMPTKGWLTVTANVAAIEIRLDGAVVTPAANQRIEAEPGVHELIVTAPAHEPWRRRVAVARGQVKPITVELRSEDRVQTLRLAGTAAVGGGIALAIAGGVATVLHHRAAEEARDIYDTETTRPLGDPGAEIPIRTRADQRDAEDRAKQWAMISHISYGAAAVAVGVGIWLLLEERPAAREGKVAPLAVVPLVGPAGHGGVGAAVTWRSEVDW